MSNSKLLERTTKSTKKTFHYFASGGTERSKSKWKVTGVLFWFAIVLLVGRTCLSHYFLVCSHTWLYLLKISYDRFTCMVWHTHRNVLKLTLRVRVWIAVFDSSCPSSNRGVTWQLLVGPTLRGWFWIGVQVRGSCAIHTRSRRPRQERNLALDLKILNEYLH